MNDPDDGGGEQAARQGHRERDQRRAADRREPRHGNDATVGGLDEGEPGPREPAEGDPVADRLLHHPGRADPHRRRGQAGGEGAQGPHESHERGLQDGKDQPAVIPRHPTPGQQRNEESEPEQEAEPVGDPQAAAPDGEGEPGHGDRREQPEVVRREGDGQQEARGQGCQRSNRPATDVGLRGRETSSDAGRVPPSAAGARQT